MKTKTFDCVDMKRKAQEEIRRRVRGMTPQEEIEFFQEGSARFLEALRRAKEDHGQAPEPAPNTRTK
ncbi:MAG: hypothetical protein FLDDKLPJ_01583 [Phycisphaerae bacterium]|nr:hypothetical protein [Phycisphaerae bacterium]